MPSSKKLLCAAISDGPALDFHVASTWVELSIHAGWTSIFGSRPERRRNFVFVFVHLSSFCAAQFSKNARTAHKSENDDAARGAFDFQQCNCVSSSNLTFELQASAFEPCKMRK